MNFRVEDTNYFSSIHAYSLSLSNQPTSQLQMVALRMEQVLREREREKKNQHNTRRARVSLQIKASTNINCTSIKYRITFSVQSQREHFNCCCCYCCCRWQPNFGCVHFCDLDGAAKIWCAVV